MKNSCWVEHRSRCFYCSTLDEHQSFFTVDILEKIKKKNQSNYVTNSRVAEEMVQPEASQEAWSLYAQHCVEVRPAGASWVGVGVSGRR